MSGFEAPKRYWFIGEDEAPDQRAERRPSIVYSPSDTAPAWGLSDGMLWR